MRLYLASESPRRRKLLRDAGVKFKVLKVPYHEARHRKLGPSALVRRHALGKALAAAGLIREGRVLAADTIVYFRGRIVGKPSSLRGAMKTLSSLQGRAHTVHTGVAVLDVRKGRVVQRKVFVETTRVHLVPMDAARIRSYFRRVEPLDKAGSYAIQDTGAGIVKKVEGSFSNAVGLPMERLKFL